MFIVILDDENMGRDTSTYYDITTHIRKDIPKNRIFGNGRPNLHMQIKYST